MSEVNESFIAATRSTAFTLSLSHKMCEELLWCHAIHEQEQIHADLASRYDWMHPEFVVASFGSTTAEDAWAQASGTTRALLRRGLLYFAERYSEAGATVHERRPTRAGIVLAELLLEAGFERPKHFLKATVPLHPDDRPRITFGADGKERVDRRMAMAMPGDEQYFSWSAHGARGFRP